LAAAIEAGINFFDVAPYYGATLAEERLGEALAHKRQQVYLATKCGRYGSATFDFSEETIVREFDQSLRRLRTEYVDLLQQDMSADRTGAYDAAH
jgi:L-galactose dehydrogenase